MTCYQTRLTTERFLRTLSMRGGLLHGHLRKCLSCRPVAHSTRNAPLSMVRLMVAQEVCSRYHLRCTCCFSCFNMNQTNMSTQTQSSRSAVSIGASSRHPQPALSCRLLTTFSTASSTVIQLKSSSIYQRTKSWSMLKECLAIAEKLMRSSLSC